MKQDLETLRLELEEYLSQKPFTVFHGLSRAMDEFPNIIGWDSYAHPDFRGFLDCAEKLGAKVIVLHTRRLSEQQIDDALEDLQDLEMPYEDRREYEKRLREIRMYTGFTCAIEMSFDFEHQTYLYQRATDWYEEVMNMIEDIETAGGLDPDDADFPGGNGGFYSKN
jgi:sugar phosphate isomerase/epimerase